jgi:hypothetical protein
MRLDAQIGCGAARSIMREKPGADSGAPRSGQRRMGTARFPADGGGARGPVLMTSVRPLSDRQQRARFARQHLVGLIKAVVCKAS